MRKRELIQAQKDYRRFDKYRTIIIKILIIFLVAILVCFIASFREADENRTPLIFFLGILIVYTIIIIFVYKHLAHKHDEYYVAAYGNDTDIIHNGLFGELWQEFERNQYEGLTDGKVVFAQTHNNTIDLQIIRNKHEFSIEVDCEFLYMICDEETDVPIKREIPLSELKDVRDFFLTIRDFIEKNS